MEDSINDLGAIGSESKVDQSHLFAVRRVRRFVCGFAALLASVFVSAVNGKGTAR